MKSKKTKKSQKIRQKVTTKYSLLYSLEPKVSVLGEDKANPFISDFNKFVTMAREAILQGNLSIEEEKTDKISDRQANKALFAIGRNSVLKLLKRG